MTPADPPPPRRALVVEHQADAPAGIAGEWLAGQGTEVTMWRPTEGGPPPALDGHDLVVVLGSEHGVNDGLPWIPGELDLVRDADAAGVPVLGICFGGQVLAAALGGRVDRAPHPEVGWVTLESDAPDLVPPGPWMAWHLDALVPPEDAVEIARSPAGSHAFLLGPHLGVQFHPEATPEIVDGWAAHAGEERVRALGADTQDLARDSRAHEAPARGRALALFDAFWRRARGLSPRG